jgi:alpha-galactosidase
VTGAQVAVRNGLALTPPMGFNDWNAYRCDVSESLIKQTARAMLRNGMAAAGYRYLNIDDCWMQHRRGSNGYLLADRSKFPDGIRALATWLHRRNLEFGLYEDVGTKTCAGYPGSLGRERKDADTFAHWDVDYVKYDECNIPFRRWPRMTRQRVHAMLYRRVADALGRTGRPMVLSMCDGQRAEVSPWRWGGKLANLWRTTPDIHDTWASMTSIVAANSRLARYAHRGAWNDPDMLEVGNGGMTLPEYRSEFSLWAMMAAPLIAGTKLVGASPQTLDVYLNKSVIAVDQDAKGVQGRLAVAGRHEVFRKPLANGDVAVALFNATSAPAHFGISAARAGLPKAPSYTLHNLWTTHRRTTRGRIGALVQPHTTVLFRVRAAR